MNNSRGMPDISRLSVIMATITLSLSLTRVIPENANILSLNLFGFFIDLNFDFGSVIAIFTAIMSAAGSHWLVLSHPSQNTLSSKWYSYVRHWIIPVFTAFVITTTLNVMARGNAWWVVFGLGSFLLMMVMIAEYNIVDISNINHPIASVGLIALSFTLYLILAIAIRTADTRLYIGLPVLVLAAGLVCSRTMYLRLHGKWLLEWVAVITLVMSQLIIGFHYLPLKPIQFGIFSLGILYALTSLFCALYEKRERFALLAEPLSMLLLIYTIGFLTG